MKITKYIAFAVSCLTLLVALRVIRRRDDDMQPETHHEINSPSPMTEA
jgi:hypothetical protein